MLNLYKRKLTEAHNTADMILVNLTPREQK